MTDAVKSPDFVRVFKGKEQVEALKGVDLSIGKANCSLCWVRTKRKNNVSTDHFNPLVPTKGDAMVFGYSVLTPPSEVRKHTADDPHNHNCRVHCFDFSEGKVERNITAQTRQVVA